jgi:hypothetical protein
MGRNSANCPHPGCDHRNRSGAQYCARCGRPLIETPIATGFSWAPLMVFLLCLLLALPCWMSNFAVGGFSLYVFPALGWLAFRPRRR